LDGQVVLPDSFDIANGLKVWLVSAAAFDGWIDG
jgi:hypothetical protein